MPEDLSLDEAFEPGEMDSFVQRAMFRDPEFTVKRIGGTPEDPKFTYHMLNFQGPNWFGWIRISIIGKAWQDQANHRYAIHVMVRRTDGPMFMARNDRNELIMDLGKDYDQGRMERLPAPEELYPYLEAALDENEPLYRNFHVENDDDIDKLAYGLGHSILHYMKGAKFVSESMDPADFMREIVGQGGFRPLRWKTFRGHVARGNENWSQDQYTLPVTSFDDKIYGSITIVVDIDSPDDARANDGMVKYSMSFHLHTGSMKQHRHQKAQHLINKREDERAGRDPMIWIPPLAQSEAWLEAGFRGKLEWLPKIKKCFELLVTKYWRPLLDQRSPEGQPLLKQNEEALRKEFMDVFKHQDEVGGIGESINLSPEEFEEFGKVASDIQYISPWRKANGGLGTRPNRFIDVWVCDINVAVQEEKQVRSFTGYLTSYRGSEEPWLLHVGIQDQYSRGKYIVGYFKTEPTERVLDRVRDAALQQVHAYLNHENDIPWKTKDIAIDFAANIQAHVKDDPEVLTMNNITESRSEVSDFVDDFLTREGIGEWKPNTTVFHYQAEPHHNEGFNFRFDNLSGLVAFSDYTYEAKRVQSVHVQIVDNRSHESYGRVVSNADENVRWHIQVSDDQVEAMKEALVDFIGRDVRAMNKKALASGFSLLPQYQGVITRKLLNTMFPWSFRGESLTPGDLYGEMAAHGGPPLEWYRDMHYERKTFRLDIPWLDRSHRAVMICSYTPEMGERVWNVGLAIEVLKEYAEGSDYQEVTKFNSLTMLTPKTMPQFQQRTIEFAKWLIKAFNAQHPLMDQYGVEYGTGVTHKQQVNLIKQEFDMATNWTGLKESEDIEAFLKGVDLTGTMRPWEMVDYREVATMHPHIHHGTKIQHNNEFRPFNDYIELNVDYFLSHDTASGMPTEPFVLITGSYKHRGWSSREMKPITVKYKTDEEVLPIVDEFARHYLVRKVAANKGTPGMFSYFRNKLAAALESKGMWVESIIDGHSGEEVIGGAKYWLDREGVFHYFDDHEDIKATFQPGWEMGYSRNELEYDAAWQEAVKRGFVRVTTWGNITFNPPASDLQMAALKQAAMEKGWPLIADYPGRPPRTIWEPFQEAVPGLIFRSECTAAYSGQTNMTLYAELEGEVVGRIDYVEYQGGVTVQWIKVRDDMQRKGIATAMAKELQRQFPDTEVEWSAATNMGAEFIDALNREFQDNPDYGRLKAAYDAAKAEYDALQAEFDAWEGGPLKDNPDMFQKGERLNELDALIFDLEDQLRGMKPGRWMIKENMDPGEFTQSFLKDSSIEGWIGADMNHSMGAGTYLYANRKGLLGPHAFNVYVRPDNRQMAGPEFDASFQVSSWATQTGNIRGGGTSECPDIWLRLSPTKGRPSFQPGTIDDFMADLKQAVADFAPVGCKVLAQHQCATTMFGNIFNRLKRKGWQMDVDKHGGLWDLDDPSFNESLVEAWSPDEMAEFTQQALTCHVEWQTLPFRSDVGDYTATDWIMHVSAPYGQLSEQHNYIRMRFFQQNEDGLIRVGMSAHFAGPHWAKNGWDRDYVAFYDHLDMDRHFVIRPGDEEALRKDVEAAFFASIGNAINTSPPKEFNLKDCERSAKIRFTALQRKWWAGDWIPPL